MIEALKRLLKLNRPQEQPKCSCPPPLPVAPVPVPPPVKEGDTKTTYQEKCTQVVTMYKAGLTVREIQEKTKFRPNEIYRIIHQNAIKLRRAK